MTTIRNINCNKPNCQATIPTNNSVSPKQLIQCSLIKAHPPFWNFKLTLATGNPLQASSIAFHF